jgi:hypothetical protein
MLTRKEARAAVLGTLEERHRLDPVNYNELLIFAIEMNSIIRFPTEGDPLSDIEEWAEGWLRAKQRPRLVADQDAAKHQ